MASEEFKFKGQGFQGIVITGWSRYDHFAVLAELLPAAMPSLVSHSNGLENSKKSRQNKNS